MGQNNQALPKNDINAQAIEEAKRIEFVLRKFIKIDPEAIEVIFSISKYADKHPEKYSFLKKQLFKAVK